MATTILVDQDNTLTDFNESTVRFLQEIYDFKGSLDFTKFNKYNILKAIFPHYSEERITEMFEVLFSAEQFWSSMKPLEGCEEVMEELNDKYEVFIVTKPWPTSHNCIPEKLEWVKTHLPFFDISRMIFCSHKHLIHADYMIDDSPTFLASSNCKQTIAYNYPYNQEVDSTFRVNNWSEIREILL